MDIKELQTIWDALGRKDPLRAGLPCDERLYGEWSRDDFFATGVIEIDALLACVETKGLARSRRRALDFGCGIGRLTQPLGAIFDEVHGVDIAPSLIEAADRRNSHGHRCRYHLNDTNDLKIFRDNQFDLILCMRTLQYMEPRYARRYLAEFVRVLDYWGALVFQLPAGPRRRSPGRLLKQFVGAILPGETRERLLATKVRTPDGPVLVTHSLGRKEVEICLQGCGAEIVDVVEDDLAGPQWQSLRYCVTKC